MGIEGRDKVKTLETGAAALSNQLGKTVQRLRKAYNLSLSDLSEQSGVAKSIISQIERNETNPTLATIWRLSQALDVSIERVLQAADDGPFLEKSSRGDTPILVSEDGKCRLAIIGWIKTVEWLQWYDFSADPGGVLESEAHQRGSVESLSVNEGELEVEVGGPARRARGTRQDHAEEVAMPVVRDQLAEGKELRSRPRRVPLAQIPAHTRPALWQRVDPRGRVP
jgi:transcriptional regulator with XRE-family HTH domain